MTEQILVKSKSIKLKWILIFFGIIAVLSVVALVVPCIPSYIEADTYYYDYIDFAKEAHKSDSNNNNDYYSGIVYDEDGKATRFELSRYDVISLAEADSRVSYAMEESNLGEMISASILMIVVCVLTGLLIWALLRFTTLTVTDKRVYYKFIFLEYSVIPIDAITSTSAFFLMGVSVGSSSKKIRICLITNYKQIHETVIKLMTERHSELKETTATAPVTV